MKTKPTKTQKKKLCLRQADWLGCFALIFATSKNRPKYFFPAELHWFGRFPPMFLLHQKNTPKFFFLRSSFGLGVFDTVFATSTNRPKYFFPAELNWFGRFRSCFCYTAASALSSG
jgi:hypothetical protein